MEYKEIWDRNSVSFQGISYTSLFEVEFVGIKIKKL